MSHFLCLDIKAEYDCYKILDVSNQNLKLILIIIPSNFREEI